MRILTIFLGPSCSYETSWIESLILLERTDTPGIVDDFSFSLYPKSFSDGSSGSIWAGHLRHLAWL